MFVMEYNYLNIVLASMMIYIFVQYIENQSYYCSYDDTTTISITMYI